MMSAICLPFAFIIFDKSNRSSLLVSFINWWTGYHSPCLGFTCDLPTTGAIAFVVLRFAMQHIGSPARIPTEIVGFEDRCPMHLDDRTKLY